jgi:hypothetical protein
MENYPEVFFLFDTNNFIFPEKINNAVYDINNTDIPLDINFKDIITVKELKTDIYVKWASCVFTGNTNKLSDTFISLYFKDSDEILKSDIILLINNSDKFYILQKIPNNQVKIFFYIRFREEDEYYIEMCSFTTCI